MIWTNTQQPKVCVTVDCCSFESYITVTSYSQSLFSLMLNYDDLCNNEEYYERNYMMGMRFNDILN